MEKDELQIFSVLEFHPEQGAVFCRDERMLVISAQAFGALQRQLLHSLGVETTRRTLLSFGYRQGFYQYLGIEDLLGKQHTGSVVGPRLPELMGFLKAERVHVVEGINPPSFRIQLCYRNSVEAEQYRLRSGLSSVPVCWWSIGFASGYCSAAFEREIYYRESGCAAQGHEVCEVTGQDAFLWGSEAEALRKECGIADEAAARELWSVLRAEYSAMRKQRETVLSSNSTQGTSAEYRLRQRVSEEAEAEGFIVREAPMWDALEQAVSVARLDMPVLVQGETGSGKEFVVSLIHKQSARASQPLISINCAALTESLLEAELFGHVRGAFTGAVSDRAGLFEQADGGTLFLDEIGEMPLALQAKLLRVLENGEVRRIGSTRSIRTHVRVLAATHRNLRKMVDSGAFRQDLYFRLNSFIIHLPALRERRESIPAMVQHFLAEISRKAGKQVQTLTPDVMTRLLNYAWPGNVRELKHAIERAALVAADGIIRLKDLPQEIVAATGTMPVPPQTSCLNLDQGERWVIEHALSLHQGNRMATATALNISVSTLWRKMRRYQLL